MARFRNEPGVEEELRELARLERRCCAFADWAVGTEDGLAILDVEGAGDETVAAVQAMSERWKLAFLGGDAEQVAGEPEIHVGPHGHHQRPDGVVPRLGQLPETP
jgi:hypothetical protein